MTMIEEGITVIKMEQGEEGVNNGQLGAMGSGGHIKGAPPKKFVVVGVVWRTCLGHNIR